MQKYEQRFVERAVQGCRHIQNDVYYITGQRGKLKLVLNGYSYIKNKTTSDRLYWNCAHVNTKNCRARLVTPNDIEQMIRKHGITISKGSKGKPKLELAGYAYFRNNVKGTKTYWLCAKNRCRRCKARIITCSSSGELVIKNQEHNHPPKVKTEKEFEYD